jgi:hypothetical protein
MAIRSDTDVRKDASKFYKTEAFKEKVRQIKERNAASDAPSQPAPVQSAPKPEQSTIL